MSKITFNGQSYSSIDEMPPATRRAYEQVIGILADKNRNGVPDILEGAIGAGEVNVQTASISSSTTQIVLDGQVYSNANELPPQARQKYEQALVKMEQMMGEASQSGAPDISTPISDAAPVSGRLLLVAGVVIAVLLIALGVFAMLALR